MTKELFQPLSGNVMPRFAGPATFMRLPACDIDAGLDVAFVGVPLDIGTSNRPGARLAPRQIRDESRMLRPYNMATRAAPFDSLRIADVGDVPINTFNLLKSMDIIEQHYERLLATGAIPLTMGGDHTIVLPILRALKRKHGPIGLVHVDAHADINDDMFGEKIAHGTPFRRAVEEGLLDGKRVVQIGIRGSIYEPGEHDWARAQGIRIIYMEEFVRRGVDDVMAEARAIVGSAPSYVTFDIDCIDPSMAPGTGTPELGGFTTREAQAMVRLLEGVNIAGADVVEVSPPFDLGNLTALAGATMMFELLCVMARGVATRR